MSKARRRAPRGQSPPRRRVNAALHCHSSFATTLACHHRGIPGFHYMIVVAGGADIRCAPYATFGTQALSDVAVAALANRKACLLGQHGQIALGGTVKTALQLAVEGETLARMYVQALSLGEPPILSDEEIDRVMKQMRGIQYGPMAAAE
jgi:L-fuculose-phosphate aldolase